MNQPLTFNVPAYPFILESGHAVYTPGMGHINRTALGVYDLLVVTRGVLHIGEENDKWAVSAGEYLILLPWASHYCVKPCEEQTHFYWIHFQHEAGSEKTMNASPTQTVSIAKYGRFAYPAKWETRIKQIVELHWELPSSAHWKRQHLFLELLEDLHRENKERPDPRILAIAERAEAFLRQHYKEPVTYTLLGEKLHFHPNYVARCMQKTFQCTPMQYLINFRLDQAKQLLLKTDLPVSHIAEHVGFHQHSYFSRSFKQKEGLTPAQFRRQYTLSRSDSVVE